MRLGRAAAAGAAGLVWIRTEDGGRFAAALMSLEPTGTEGQMFCAAVPADRAPAEVVALDEDGEVLASEPLHFP